MDWGLPTLISTLIKDAEVFSCVKLYGQDFDYLITIQFKWHNFQFTIKKLEDLENVPCLGNYLNMEHNNYVGFKICQTNTPIEKSRYILLNIDHRLNSTINLSLIIVEGNRTMKANIPWKILSCKQGCCWIVTQIMIYCLLMNMIFVGRDT